MDTSVMLLDCPAYLDKVGAARCGLPAAVEYRYTMQSTDGPLESVKIRCPRGHSFNGPLESMLWDKGPQRNPAVFPDRREPQTGRRGRDTQTRRPAG